MRDSSTIKATLACFDLRIYGLCNPVGPVVTQAARTQPVTATSVLVSTHLQFRFEPLMLSSHHEALHLGRSNVMLLLIWS
jgi:hypothetical protein